MLFLKSKEEKELLKKMKEEEEALEKEIDAQMPKEKIKLVDLIFDEDEEDKELLEYMTDEEKAEMEAQKKENKRLIIIIGSIFGALAIGLTAFLFFFSEAVKSDLLKVTLPLMEEYYESEYQEKLEYHTIDYLCHTVDNKEECSNIVSLKTKDNRHIMAINNELLGDDIRSERITNDYNDYMHASLAELDLIGNSAILSYQDYYLDYNIHADYIKSLPASLNFEALLNSKKLTITDIILYKGSYNYNYIKNFLNKFSSDSILYLIGTTNGMPNSLSIISSDFHYEFNITATIELDKKITYYELDRNKNNVASVSVKSIGENDIATKDNYIITNAYGFTFEETKNYNREEQKPSYYFLRIDDTNYSESNIYEFSMNGYKNTYEELDSDEYIPVITYRMGNATFIISNQQIGIGTIKEKTSFLCQFGLC